MMLTSMEMSDLSRADQGLLNRRFKMSSGVRFDKKNPVFTLSFPVDRFRQTV